LNLRYVDLRYHILSYSTNVFTQSCIPLSLPSQFRFRFLFWLLTSSAHLHNPTSVGAFRFRCAVGKVERLSNLRYVYRKKTT